jgi:hypothetical protein
VRHWQRHDVLVSVSDITDIEADPARVVVVSKDDRKHPHAGAAPARGKRSDDRGGADPGGTRRG